MQSPHSETDDPRQNKVKDRLWKFTAISVSESTAEAHALSRLYRRESCNELAVDVQGMQLEKMRFADEPDEHDEIEEAYSIRMDRTDIANLINQYRALKLEDLKEEYDFEPEVDFLDAAYQESGQGETILVICLVIDDGETMN